MWMVRKPLRKTRYWKKSVIKYANGINRHFFKMIFRIVRRVNVRVLVNVPIVNIFNLSHW